MSNHQRGFTLTELMVTLAVIAILLSVATPLMLNYSTSARSAQAVNNIYTLEVALSDYYTDNGTYIIGQYDANGSKTLQTGPLDWQPAEADDQQQYSYQVLADPSCGSIAICYQIWAVGLGREVPTNQRVRKASNGNIIIEELPAP